MKRLLLNGSPRGKESNSRLLLSWLAEGMSASGAPEVVPVLDIARVKELDSQRKAFLEAEEVVLCFPLYTDSMPGIVKNFIESLAGASPETLKGKRVAFIVQSGFPESIHSEAVAAYLERLCRRLGLSHAGTVIKGGVEGVRIMPERMQRKLKAFMVRAGRELASEGRFSAGLSGEMARPRVFGLPGRLIVKLISLTGMGNFYWNMMLKKHGAFEKRFDAPYGEKASSP